MRAAGEVVLDQGQRARRRRSSISVAQVQGDVAGRGRADEDQVQRRFDRGAGSDAQQRAFGRQRGIEAREDLVGALVAAWPGSCDSRGRRRASACDSGCSAHAVGSRRARTAPASKLPLTNTRRGAGMSASGRGDRSAGSCRRRRRTRALDSARSDGVLPALVALAGQAVAQRVAAWPAPRRAQAAGVDDRRRQRRRSWPAGSRAGARHRRDAILDPGVAVRFEFQRQFRAAALDDAAVGQHVHDVRPDVVEQALVVGDDEEGAVRRAHQR